jgi:hypothetical protein
VILDLIAELNIPSTPTKCAECTDLYYIDHDLIYCNVCHHHVVVIPTPHPKKETIPPKKWYKVW